MTTIQWKASFRSHTLTTTCPHGQADQSGYEELGEVHRLATGCDCVLASERYQVKAVGVAPRVSTMVDRSATEDVGHDHPRPLRLSDVPHEAKMAASAVVGWAQEQLGLTLDVKFYDRWDAPAQDEGFTCTCNPSVLWLQSSGQFWRVLETGVHEAVHAQQLHARGAAHSDGEYDRREREANTQAAQVVERLRGDWDECNGLINAGGYRP